MMPDSTYLAVTLQRHFPRGPAAARLASNCLNMNQDEIWALHTGRNEGKLDLMLKSVGTP